MSFMDRVKGGFDKAREGVSDLAETTRIKWEISKLNERKTELFTEIGRQMSALYTAGRVIPEIEPQCKTIRELDEEIRHKAEEIAQISMT